MLGSGTVQIFQSGLTPTQIKTLLYTQGPVMVGVYADPGFMKYSTGTYSSCPSNAASSINHAVLLYGYDASGNWLIKNQWDTTWGQQGFMVLSSTRDCGMSTLLGNIQFSTPLNNNPNVTISSSMLYTYNAKW
jgi:hypothetical protein